MPRKTPLRAVGPDELVASAEAPLGLMEAVEAGDMLAILRAQRRIIAEGLLKAQENTRPQYSNELNKLNRAIAEEELRRSTEEGEASVVAPLAVEAWDGTGF